MATAFELSRPEHEGRYQVTVYQQGWRLGGKGASGRGPNDRIEEHGLHVWMGWYENAFGLLRECYRELGRNWRQAFEPAPLIAVTDRTADGGWEPWIRLFPPAEGLPGDPRGDTSTWTARGYFMRSVQLLRALIAGLETSEKKAPTGDLLADLARYGEIGALAAISQAVTSLEAVTGSAAEHPDSSVLTVIDAIGEAARRALENRLEGDLETRRIWQVIDLLLATIRGNIRSGLLTDPRGFDAIDEYDCREWLLLNGASQSSVDSAYLRGLYDLGFGYENGDPEKPSVSAAQALRGFLRAFFTYRGSFFWKMNAGMGDVVFAPLYEVLSRRGVRFQFFHRLRDVRLSGHTGDGDGETPHVSTLELDVQAHVKDGARYQPLVDVKGLPCWPSMPDFGQLEDGERLRRENRQFESHWDERSEERLTLEVGKDFDFVVLGIGIGAIPHVCSELVTYDPRWRAMVDHVKTVATQAFQLWLRPSTEELGWPGPPITLSGFAKPFETWADMGHLLEAESWPEPPGALAYFCGALPDVAALGLSDQDGDRSAIELVRRNVARYLDENIRHLWPGAVDEEGRFRWELLVPADGRSESESLIGEARLASQYLRANVNPTDRYTLSLPGSSAYRISPLDPSYDNLVVCGDWTDCGFNSGCVEAAVMSGRLAAHALSTKPALEDIVGYDHP